MSTVLWAHQLLEGKVTSDESDKWALYKYAKALDQVAAALKLPLFSSLFDHTDMKVNMGQEKLPAGMDSSNDLMARDGVWKSGEEAHALLNGLLTAMTLAKPAFKDYDAVVAELTESIEFAKKAAGSGAKFNFVVVM